MLVAPTSVVGFNYNLPPPALRERRHRGLARQLVAMRWRAVFGLPEGEGPRHGLPTGAAAVLHDAWAITAVRASYSGAGWNSCSPSSA